MQLKTAQHHALLDTPWPLGPAFDQQPCDLCGWHGPRAVREVNYWHAQWAWACRVCFFGHG